MNNTHIREIKMPLTIRGFTIPDENGDFNIYINCDLSEEAKKRSLKHELTHIKDNHFCSPLYARLIEASMK